MERAIAASQPLQETARRFFSGPSGIAMTRAGADVEHHASFSACFRALYVRM
jgi:hypothetical protein